MKVMRENDDPRLEAYVLVTVEAGKTRSIVRAISDLQFPGCRVVTVEPVFGKFDIIVRIEGQDIESLGRAMFEGIQDLLGVNEVVPSLCVKEIPAVQVKPSERAATQIVSANHN
jgi:DNA-binding Lrp family transcriptional regulator